MTPVLELRSITKRFPGVLANDHIDLTLEQGEIHALLGENGAGKTTLMNILYGLYKQDEGEIFVRGKPIQVTSPNDAIRAGIGMVHQHFMLIPVFTVTENVMLGYEDVQVGDFLDRKASAEKIRQISKAYKLEVNPDDYVKDLPVGVQQRVEIIKLLYRAADILILDEPTAVLTPQEADELFKIMHSLVEQGKSIIFITHKLREVMEVADRITVIRRGKVIGTTTPAEADQRKLAEMMVGREVQLELEKEPPKLGETVFSVENLVVTGERHQVAVNNVSLEVRAGEILGIAGVQGNGQTELVEAITGLRPALQGTIHLKGQTITHAMPRPITELGTAHVPEDRQRDGLVLSFPVADNLILSTYYVPPFSKGVVLQEPVIVDHANRLIEEFDIRTPSALTPAGSLSGGNQQKVIIARELSRPIDFLVASQPTRGLDVGSIEYIHRRILEKRDAGCAVLLVSSELDEIMELADRIAVMYRGEIIDILDAKEATKEGVGLLMAGVKSGAPPVEKLQPQKQVAVKKVQQSVLRLADPAHPARKEIDRVVNIIDQNIQVEIAGDRTVTKISDPDRTMSAAVSILTELIAQFPEDMDLLSARASAFNASAQGQSAQEDLEAILKRIPEHFEAQMWKNHGEQWSDAFRYPKWDEALTTLHAVMATHLQLGHRVQIVRDGLQKALAIVTNVQGPPFDPRTKVKVSWVLSKTPYGPLVAYYLKLIEPDGEPSTLEAFLPIFQPQFIPMEGYCLVQQLAFTPYCFVVLVNDKDVLLNRRVLFGPKTIQKIREIAGQIASAQSYLPQNQFQNAMQWHMNHFKMDGLDFE